MNFRNSQLGISFWGLLYVVLTLGFIAMFGIKCGPVYLNQMSVTKIVNEVARKNQGGAGDVDVQGIKSELGRRWDVDYIKYIEAKDVAVVRSDKGMKLSYDYEARVPLFYNMFIVMHFAEDVPIRGTNNG